VNRALICLVLAVAYAGYRYAPPQPAAPVVVPHPEVAGLAKQMTATDRAALRETYAILSRSIAANPETDPVFPDTASVRRAHRAALLAVWRGVLGNEPGKYAGLREGLEGYLTNALGDADVPLTPELQARVAKTFLNISDSLK